MSHGEKAMKHGDVVVRLSSQGRIQIWGGDPEGDCPVHKTVAKWPGWRRLPRAGSRDGRSCSIFQARIWPSTVIPLAAPPFQNVQWDPDAHEAVRNELDKLGQMRTQLDLKLPAHLPKDSGYRLPRPHQMQAIMAAQTQPGWLIGDEMGLGKTSTALWIYERTKIPRLLVLCPKFVKFNWQREIERTLGSPNAGWAVVLIDGTKRQRSKKWGELRYLAENRQDELHAIIAIANYDMLPFMSDQQWEILDAFIDQQALICDESHYLRNREAQRTDLILNRIAPKADLRLCLTGTPIWNTAQDLWSQLEICRPGMWNGYQDFANRYLVIVPHKFNERQRRASLVVRGTRNIDELNAVVNTAQIRRLKKNVLDLPPKEFTYPELEFEKPMRQVYDVLKKWARIQIDKLGSAAATADKTIFHPEARSAVETAMRCEQLCQGFIGGLPKEGEYLEELMPKVKDVAELIPGRPGELMFPQSPKIEWLKETVDALIQQGSHVVVFSRFNAPLFWLQKLWNCAFMHGGVEAKQRDDMVMEFQDNRHEVMLCQVKVAQGFNLTNSQDCIFLGRDWAPATNLQAEDRLHRMGTKGTVNVQIPMVKDTIEDLIHKKLMSKRADAEQALRNVTLRELRDAL